MLHIAGKPFSPVMGNQQDFKPASLLDKAEQMSQESKVVLEKSNILMLGPTGSGVLEILILEKYSIIHVLYFK